MQQVTLALVLCAASQDADEAVSLLQTSAVQRHEVQQGPGGCCGTNSDVYGQGEEGLPQTLPDPPAGTGKALGDGFRVRPDPKKKSKTFCEDSGGQLPCPAITLANDDEVDFECNGGKGKWIYYMQAGIPPASHDLSSNIMKIQQIYTAKDTGFTHAVPWIAGGASNQLVELGEVQDEKDCYCRARLDAGCHELYETDVYSESTWVHNADGSKHREINPAGREGNVGVIWMPLERFGKSEPRGADANHAGTHRVNRCYCARVPPKLEAQHPHAVGSWFCQLNSEDMDNVDENTDSSQCGADDDEPKEKKTPEEREACQAHKTKAKASKQALKNLREQLKANRKAVKDTKALVRAAKETFLQDKGARDAVC